MEAYLEEFTDEEQINDELMDADDICYENVKTDINALRNKLNTYIITRTSLE